MYRLKGENMKPSNPVLPDNAVKQLRPQQRRLLSDNEALNRIYHRLGYIVKLLEGDIHAKRSLCSQNPKVKP